MLGRREFGVASLSALAVTALDRSVFAQPRADGDHAQHDEMMQACAEACSNCQRSCEMCSTHCAGLVGEGNRDHAITLATCRDCADFCGAAAQIVARSGPFAGLICEACAAACARCGEQCEKFPNDKHMQMCAKECRKCEKACQDMIKHVGLAN